MASMTNNPKNDIPPGEANQLDKLSHWYQPLPHLVIYHGGCPDGIAAAWAVSQRESAEDDVKYHPGRFNEDPPDVTNQNVLFVDFTYTQNVMELLLKTAKSIRVLDHHKSALYLKNITDKKLSYVLDMNRSGAQIAWDEMNPQSVPSSKSRPWFIDDIADRDLWRWELPNSKITTRAMFGLDYYSSLTAFSEKISKLYNKSYYTTELEVNADNYTELKAHVDNYDELVSIGKTLLNEDERSYKNITKYAVDCICTSLTDPSVMWKCRVVECDGSKKSEVGNRLVLDGKCDFSVIYQYNIIRDEWWLSLRALSSSNIDLTKIVKHFGNGGGHPKASGSCIHGSKGHNLKTLFKPVPNNMRFSSLETELTTEEYASKMRSIPGV
jgi:oligoribonuclease NrnB/cAMP/cGMP phosphodiesterase (DHH superfamily)